VPFDQLNTAQQFALSIRLAKLRLGRLPLLVMDRGETFDAETWEAFRESAKESGLQIVAARVSSGALRVGGDVMAMRKVELRDGQGSFLNLRRRAALELGPRDGASRHWNTAAIIFMKCRLIREGR